jgi:hypothetical protein
MKLKAFLERVNKQGKINNEDFTKALEKLTDESELPDVWVNLFEENFLTRERAAADFDITKKIKAESLNGVDEKLKGVIALLDASTKEEFEKENNTYKKVEMLQAVIPKMIEKIKGDAGPSTDEKVKQLERNNQELVEKIKTINSEAEKRVKDIHAEFEGKEKNMKLEWTLDKKLNEFVFADEFNDVKGTLLKAIITDVKGKNHLSLDDNGQVIVQEIVNGVAKPKFNGNDPVTIDSLLTEPVQKFLKKNNAGDNKDGQQQQQQAQTRTSTTTTRTVATQAASDSNLDRRRSARQNTPV